MKPISRRDFLKSVTAGALGIAASGFLGGCSTDSPASTAAASVGTSSTSDNSWHSKLPSWFTAPDVIPEDKISETITSDVVIIGAGMAGICCAASCQEHGLFVTALEKNSYGRAFGLDFGCINSAVAEEFGVPYQDDYAKYMMTRRWVAESGGRSKANLIKKFIDNSGRAIDWITEKSRDYGCTPVIAAYSSKSDTYSNVPGTVEFHDGPAWDATAESFGARDIVDMLTKQLEDANMPVLFNTKAEQLERDGNGRVSSVICTNTDGEYIRYTGTKAVVLATGDFAADQEMVDYYTCWDLSQYNYNALVNYSSGTGDGHKMGIWAGGVMEQKPQPLMLLPFTYPYFYLHVNNLGKRFMNEDTNSVAMSIGQLTQPKGEAFSIWDSKWNTEIPSSLEYGGGMDWDQDFRIWNTEWDEAAEQATHDYNIENGSLYICDTLEELAEAMNIPKETFLNTVERYNELSAKGSDDDFGKRKELLTSISEGPFYALRMFTGLCTSVGGLTVDINHQTLDENGVPITGLYAIGNTASDLHTDGEYIESVVPGNSLGRCVTFGYLLGEILAQA